MTTEQRILGDRRRQRRLEQARLRSIVECMADGIVIVSLDGIICFVNPAAERLFARTEAQLTGTYFGFPAVAGESAEIDVVRPTGETISVELRVVEMEWEGAPARLASLRDVTDRKRAEERSAQLERERLARVEAEAASQAKSDFLATMSHELRTPLNAVLGYSELLDLGIAGSLSHEQRHQVSRIRASGRHLLGLVNELLDLAKVEAGRLALQHSVARAEKTVDEALALIQPLAEQQDIAVATSRTADDGDGALYAGDEDRARQILVNLLNNAVKFTRPGGRITVEHGVSDRPDQGARTRGDGPWTYFRVADTGIGIPAEQLPAIFDPFVQVDVGHTRSRDGSGLGLTISRRLARLMKGDLTVESEVGAGSAFTLWLPAVSPSSAETQRWRPATTADGRLLAVGEAATILQRGVEGLLEAFVTHLRTEHIIPAAGSLRFSHLAGHLGSFVVSLGTTLLAIEEARGQPSPLVSDATDILRAIAERHGVQRARLGWTKEALHHEWRLVREEIERALRRGSGTSSSTAIAEATVVVDRFIEDAEEMSTRALVRTHADEAAILQSSPTVSSGTASAPLRADPSGEIPDVLEMVDTDAGSTRHHGELQPRPE